MAQNTSKQLKQTLTLLIGILTAMLLIFGTFFQASDMILDLKLVGWIFEAAPLEQVKVFSSAVIKTIQSFNL